MKVTMKDFERFLAANNSHIDQVLANIMFSSEGKDMGFARDRLDIAFNMGPSIMVPSLFVWGEAPFPTPECLNNDFMERRLCGMEFWRAMADKWETHASAIMDKEGV